MNQFHNHAQKAPLYIVVRLIFAGCIYYSTYGTWHKRVPLLPFLSTDTTFLYTIRCFQNTGANLQVRWRILRMTVRLTWRSGLYDFAFFSIENQLARIELCEICKKDDTPRGLQVLCARVLMFV